MNNTPSGPDFAPSSSLPLSALNEPTPDAVLSQLDRIAKSDVFSGAVRQQRLLRHLVTKRLNGAVGELKEYTLGVEVFDRGEDFDPRLDPIVRVEASRLRSRLQKYYDGAGVTDPVRITLPRGAYLPSFAGPTPSPVLEVSKPEEILSIPAQPVEAPPSEHRKGSFWLFAGSLGVLAGVGIMWWLLRPAPIPGPPHYLRFQRITNDEVLCTSPTFSPDDRKLAYAQRDNGTWHIYEQDLAGSAPTDLTPDTSEDDYQPAWSPDGHDIAFRSEQNGGGLFLLDTQSRAISRLTSAGYDPSWSPDGQSIAFSTSRFGDPVESQSAGDSALKILNLRTKQERQITSPGAENGALQPAWSPHGDRIAYWKTDANGNRDIWTVNADAPDGAAAHPVPVTHDAWTDWSPAWTPNGHYLYFSSDRSGAMNLWRVRIDEKSGAVGGQPEPVTTPSSYSGWPVFAHSGKKFAYVRWIPYSELYKAPFDINKGLDLATKTQLTSGEHSMHEPEISPDGRWIVVRIQDPQEDLALIRPNGSDFRRLTNDVYDDRDPHWAPDGKYIVFNSNRTHHFELWKMHPDGTGLTQLTDSGMVPYAWTPDGSLVAYPPNRQPYSLDPKGRAVPDWGLPQFFRPLSWSRDQKSVVGRMHSNDFARDSLFVFTPESHDYWEIAPSAPYSSNVWMQDSQHLLFSREGGIYLADVHSHQLKQELSTVRSNVHARFTASPDDHTLYFVQSDDQEDIWMGSE